MPFISEVKDLRHKDSLSMHGMDARCRVCKDPNDRARFETRRGQDRCWLRNSINLSSLPNLSCHISKKGEEGGRARKILISNLLLNFAKSLLYKFFLFESLRERFENHFLKMILFIIILFSAGGGVFFSLSSLFTSHIIKKTLKGRYMLVKGRAGKGLKDSKIK